MREPIPPPDDSELSPPAVTAGGAPPWTEPAKPGRTATLRMLTGTPLRQAVLVAALWRLLVAAMGVGAHYAMAPGPHLKSLIHRGSSPDPLTVILDPSVRNDAFWYAHIAQHGYFYSTHRLSSIGFYPLYPLTIKLVTYLVPNVYLAGTLISTTFLLGSVALLAVWLGRRGEARRAPVVTLVFLSFPFSFYFSTMYPESLFLFLALAACMSFEQGRWKLAALAVFLLVLTRPTGIVILACLAALSWKQGWSLRRDRRTAAPLAAGVAGVAAFSLYQYAAFGTPLAYAHAKAVPPWSATLGQSVSDLLLRGRYGIPSWYLALNLGIGLLFLAATPLVLRSSGPPYALFSILLVVMSLTAGLPGMQRYVTVDFPVFTAVAATPRRLLLAAMIMVSMYLQFFFVALWVAGIGVF